MTNYTVVTGDIIESRKYSNLNNILTKRLKKVEYPANMVTPFTVSRGDEIQAVFKELIALPVLIREVRYILRPLDIRFGIGYGEINESKNSINSWEMNGPAFYYARESLEKIEKEKKARTGFMSNNQIDEAINTILFLIDIFQLEWTEPQWEAIYYYEKLGTYKKAAEVLNIAFQNVGKRCNAAKWNEVKYAENSIERLMKKFLD